MERGKATLRQDYKWLLCNLRIPDRYRIVTGCRNKGVVTLFVRLCTYVLG